MGGVGVGRGLLGLDCALMEGKLSAKFFGWGKMESWKDGGTSSYAAWLIAGIVADIAAVDDSEADAVCTAEVVSVCMA